MKKNFLILFFAMVSCSKGEESLPEKDLYGTWYFESETISYSTDECYQRDTLNFNRNNIIISEGYLYGDNCQSSAHEFDYIFEGNSFSMQANFETKHTYSGKLINENKIQIIEDYMYDDRPDNIKIFSR